MTDKFTSVKSADRALVLVEYVGANGSVSFNEVLAALSLPRSSAHGLLATLVSSGWLHHNPASKRYSLGLRAWQIGQLYEGHSDLVDVARPIMDHLATATGETVQLAVLDGIENVYVAISESPNPMRLASSVGMRLQAYATGIGKALLASIDPGDAETRLRSVTLPRLTEKTVTDVDELVLLLERTRRDGFALDDEEFILGCRCVAVPLTSQQTGGMVSAMSITMPTSRTDAAWPGSILRPLSAAADEIRVALGAVHPFGDRV
ncbi:MAG: IclR family transcriptional regulator [Rhodoglobus sp.]